MFEYRENENYVDEVTLPVDALNHKHEVNVGKLTSNVGSSTHIVDHLDEDKDMANSHAPPTIHGEHELNLPIAGET